MVRIGHVYYQLLPIFIIFNKKISMEKQDYEIEWPNMPVKYLITSNSNKYIVFLDNDLDLDWKTTDEFDESISETERIEFNKIKNDVDRLECIYLDNLSELIKINYKRQLGEALVRAFDGDYDNAKEMLNHAEQFISNRNIEESRVMFIQSSGMTAGVSLIIILLLWLLRDFFISLIGITPFYISISFLFGSIGAFLSVILRLGKFVPDYNASKKLHYLEGVCKIVAGMISALVVALCIKSELILPVFSKVESTYLAMVLGGMIAGASERFVPSIIGKLDNTLNTEES